MKKAPTVLLKDEEVIELMRILMDSDAEGAEEKTMNIFCAVRDDIENEMVELLKTNP